ncbi:MAG: YeeE/YedE thiosulfate transporter family protein [Gemmobacter sp.]
MFEDLGLDMAPQTAALWFGLALGLAFGLLAEVSRFCLRRGLVGDRTERRPALGVWLMALAVSVIGTQAAVTAGLIDFGGHRFHTTDLPVVAIALGGLLFGAGMVLARGCASRVTVLAASGNLRALVVLLVLALVAQATMRGVLAPLRIALAEPGVSLGSYGALPLSLGVVLALAAVVIARRSGAGWRLLLAGAAIGALVPVAWVGTGLVLHDPFDPIPLEALSFTAPAADALLWAQLGPAVTPGLGAGLLLGVLAGAAASALASGRFRPLGFAGAAETGRYVAGGALMGFGGVLAGGCTVGAGISGVSTLGISALLALAAIAAGAVAAERLLSRNAGAAVGQAPRPAARQAA